jgi:hypothetical protein
MVPEKLRLCTRGSKGEARIEGLTRRVSSEVIHRVVPEITTGDIMEVLPGAAVTGMMLR